MGTFDSNDMSCVDLFVGMEDTYYVNFVKYDEDDQNTSIQE